jgi:hypothetical protein
VGGGPTDDKPAVTLAPPADPGRASAFLNIRVADIAAAYAEWRAKGAEFLTEPKDHGREIRASIATPMLTSSRSARRRQGRARHRADGPLTRRRFDQAHAAVYAQRPDVDEVVVFGRTAEKPAKISGQFGFATSTDLDAAMTDPSVDLVDICLPTRLYAEVAGHPHRAHSRRRESHRPADRQLVSGDDRPRAGLPNRPG